jgi:heavy metal efflux system protein
MMENIFRMLSGNSGGTKFEKIARAAAEVGSPMFFSTLIIAVAFIPLFTMSGVAGVIFSPMAHTYAFAIGGAILCALTLTPVLAHKLLPDHTHEEHDEENWLMRALGKVYKPIFSFALKKRWQSVAIGFAPVLVVFAIAPTLGREFMPKLEEGNFWIRATLPLSISLDQSAKYVQRIREIMRGCPAEVMEDREKAEKECKHPEIDTVVTQVGRPDDGTDPSGFYNIEIFAPLKPSDEWRKGISKEIIQNQLSKELNDTFPGVVFNFSQVIADNVEEAMSGVKGENTVKVFGRDIAVNEKKAKEVLAVLQEVQGIEDLGIFRSMGQPNVRITPDRVQSGRYGLNVGDVEAVVQAAIGGQAVTQVYEGEKHFDLVVRWLPKYRKDLKAIRDILIPTPDGSSVPLGQLAQIAEEEGPSMVYREDHQRYVPVKFSVRGRDLASTIDEGQDRGASEAALRDAPRVVGRDQPAQRSDRASVDHHPDHDPFDHLPRLLLGEDVDRHRDRARRDPGRMHGRHPRPLPHTDQLLDLGGDGVHIHIRDRDPRCAHRRDVHAAPLG